MTTATRDGSGSGRGVEAWERGLRDKRTAVRRRNAEHLTHLPEEAARVPHVLVELLADRDQDVRLLAAEALVGAGPAAVRPLMRALTSSRVQTREWAANLLGQLGETAWEARTALRVAATEDRAWEVRSAAHAALQAIEGPRPCGP